MLLPRLPLIEDLTSGPVPSGSNLLVEFDPASNWYNATITIAAGWLETGGRVHYNVSVQQPDNVRSQLTRKGLNVPHLEREDRVRIYDWYWPTLGRKSTDKDPIPSLKVSDLSPVYSSWIKSGELGENAETLRVIDNASTLARFNDEKAYSEFVLTRVFPRAPVWKATLIFPLVRGLHTASFYNILEASADGVIDFKLEETERGVTRDTMRIRTMRNSAFTAGWHPLHMDENLEVTLEK